MSNIPAGYQQTDIGLIPSDWEVITIDEILNFVGGSQPPRDNFIFDEKEGYVRLLQIRDICEIFEAEILHVCSSPTLSQNQ